MRTNLFVAGAALALGGAAMAAPMLFFGEDLNNSDSVELTPIQRVNSNAAQQMFLNQLVASSRETFSFEQSEGVALNTVNPAVVFPTNSITATTTGGVVRNRTSPGGTLDPNTAGREGRYPTSGDQYLNANAANFRIDFSEPIAAFGFFGIDIGDFTGRLTLTLLGGGTMDLMIPHTADTTDNDDQVLSGSVMFVGVISTDPTMQFTGVQFSNSAFGGSSIDDIFAFDDFTIGRLGELIPLPNAMGLSLAGFLGVGAVAGARRQRKA